MHDLSLFLSIQYLGEGEVSYSCVRGDLGKSTTECRAPTAMYVGLGKAVIEDLKHNKRFILKNYLCIIVLALNLLYFFICECV